MDNPKIKYWRHKLSAYMHDNPEKVTDIRSHEDRAREHQLADQFLGTYYHKLSDINAAAADRFPFPDWRELAVKFDGSASTSLRHPLGGANLTLERPFKSADEAGEIMAKTMPKLLNDGSDPENDARAEFICRWRFWRQWAAEKDERTAFLPADTRIPDHTIWNHLSFTSALEGCRRHSPDGRPALLLFSIGPVQSLIAAARNIRDLWSGSYLLSYLMATAMGPILRELGPDHLLSPSAFDQPLCDLMLKEIYSQARFVPDNAEAEESAWDQLWNNENPDVRANYLTPSIPNRFVALVPAESADEFAKKCEDALRKRLQEIAKSVFQHLDVKLPKELVGARLQLDRMENQIEQAIEVYWQTFELPDNFKKTVSLGEKLLPDMSPVESAKRVKQAWKLVKSPYPLAPTHAWAATFALLQWQHDGVKQTRTFDAWAKASSWEYGATNTKDSLTGKEEYVYQAPATKEEAQKESIKLANNQNMFRAGESLGALNLIKRLWHLTWLCRDEQGFKPEDFKMPDLHQLAKGRPFSSDSDEQDEGGYIAVLAMDGDSMGQWISGALTPPLGEQLADAARDYFSKNGAEEILKKPRPLNPSFHLQFSEALGSFSVQAARLIVEAHCGRLIYAGGDDVLAVLPADRALECARKLQAAFKGNNKALAELAGVWYRSENGDREPYYVSEQEIFEPVREGTGKLKHGVRIRLGHREETRREVPYIVPGPRADVSCGIAFGHVKSPFQDLVREAQRAEKRAKKRYGRPAVALSILKRSGEIIHWGTKWGSKQKDAKAPALDFLSKLQKEGLSARFPYKLIGQLQPYAPGPEPEYSRNSSEKPESAADPSFEAVAAAIVRRELEYTLGRDEIKADGIASILESFDAYWGAFDTYWEAHEKKPPALNRIHHFIGLLQTLAWFNKSDDTSTQDCNPKA